VVASVVTDVAAKRLWVLLAYGQRLIGVALERSLVETPASRSNARRCERSFEPEGSITGSIPTAYWSSCNSSRPKKPRFARLLQSPLTDSNRRPPPYHGTPHATGRNPRQRISHVCAVLGVLPFASGCHPLRPLGSIKAPSSVVCCGYEAQPSPTKATPRVASSGTVGAHRLPARWP
jgi:hypothetical protein